LVFVPFFVIAIALAAHARALKGTRIAALVCAVCVISGLWYMRNLIYDGDPVPPVFNLAFRGTDPNFSAQDWAGIRGDLSTHRSLRDWEAFPFEEFSNPQTIEFREYGVTAVVFSLYAIALAAPLLLFKYRKTPSEAALAYVLGFTALGMLYLMLSSSLTRYTLIIYPTVTVAAGALLLGAARRVPGGVFAAPVAALAMLIPTPLSHEFYHEFYGVYYEGLTQVMPSDDVALERFLGGYHEARSILDDPVLERPESDHVLLVEAVVNYYVELHGAHPFGDWTGDGRYHDLAAAIDDGLALQYARQHHMGAAVISRSNGPLVPEEIAYFGRQLEAGGFVQAPSSDDAYAVFVRKGQ
ncbi:MAG TPA: hypothetical protein VGD50_05505, partial [Candidatus Baltobacteraceae bacterium]